MSEGRAPVWRIYFYVGVTLILNTIFFKISISGPWNSSSFSLGVIGLIGLTLIYVSWYRFTFKRKGLVPWLDLWKDPKNSAIQELIIASLFLIFAYFLGADKMFFPTPAALIFSLIGLLMLIQSVYVLLSISILSDD
ncbi:MAG: hypothetical protein OR994_00135 [Candidatus Poseidoniales archaeon]|nr:hypothetical protein [Candidatus Poseidoniales archaeon]